MTAINIRRYKEKDREELLVMIKTVLAEFDMQVDPAGPDKDLNDINGVYTRQGNALFVAEKDGCVVGSVAVRNCGDARCRLCKLYLLKEYRGGGTGQSLLDRALEFASFSQYATMELEVSQKHGKAIRLYENAGFVQSTVPSTCPRCEFIYTKKL